jgi:serine kinase of HPr protein (carbohydrate metabolism regulator)
LAVKSIRVLLRGSEERLGVREFFHLPVRRGIGRSCPLCLPASGNTAPGRVPRGSFLILSGRDADDLRLRREREKFLNRVREEECSCLAFAENREPPEEVRRFCEQNHIALFSSSYSGPYLLSRFTGLIREKILEIVVIHGVLVNLYGLGLLITGYAGVGKTTCGLELARRGHIWVADDLLEVEKRGGKLHGRGYGTARDVIALRGVGVVESRTCPGILRIQPESPLDLWCELRMKAEEPGEGRPRHIMEVALPFSTFPSPVVCGDAPALVENWVQAVAAGKEIA